ncbi:unnamed protein product, partial [Pylaiella littoralis]
TENRAPVFEVFHPPAFNGHNPPYWTPTNFLQPSATFDQHPQQHSQQPAGFAPHVFQPPQFSVPGQQVLQNSVFRQGSYGLVSPRVASIRFGLVLRDHCLRPNLQDSHR